MAEKVLIAGTGPAGLTAALYCARADLEPICFEGPQPGGQLTITTEVENYPGFETSLTGPDLIERMHKQAEHFGARFKMVVVKGVRPIDGGFEVTTASETIESQSLIVATGASARWLGIESEEKLKGFGVSACATCDAFFFRDKTVVVVGGGDTAMEEAMFLTKFATKVYVIHRRDELRASKIMGDRAMKNSKIEFVWDSVVDEVHDPETQKVTGVTLRNVKTKETSRLDCDGLFMAIGHIPNTGFLQGLLNMDEEGFILCEPGSSRTSVPGIFACGDVMDPLYKQAVTAAGTGCRAAMDCERYLAALET